WFRLLGRLAWFRRVDEDGRVERRTFGSGLLEPGWTRADVTLAAFGVSSIIFDGLSQTQAFFDVFGSPDTLEKTVLLFAWLGVVAVAAAGVSTRALGRRQVSDAVVMVALTTVTLWSLGQALSVAAPGNAEVVGPVTRHS